jgi:hypothetical protein
METRKFGEPKTRKLDNPKFKEEEEALRKRFTEQVKLEEARFRQWEQRVHCPPQSQANTFSLSPNETVSTRIWKLPIRLSNHSNKNWRLWLEVGTGVDRIISILEGEYRMERWFVILVLCPF